MSKVAIKTDSATQVPQKVAKNMVGGEMKTDMADGKVFERMFASGTSCLEKVFPDIDAMNVFPVPDGDTGTNMLLTMRSALEGASKNHGRDASLVAESMAHGSLMGARGNSGVILSQFWRGLAEGLQGKSSFDGKDFAVALDKAKDAAYASTMNPVEGTILTVVKDAAEAARVIAQVDSKLVLVLEAAVKAAADSVAQTPELLPVLREAGVVDAGGEGLYVLLDGALSYLKGSKRVKPHLVGSNTVPMSIQREPELPYGYCTSFVLEGEKLDLPKIRKHLGKKGQSLVTSKNDTVLKVHLHTLNPGEVLKYALKFGELHDIKIDNMDDQYAEFIKKQREMLPKVSTALVTVVSGEGFFKIFSGLGAIVVPGGQTMNPSVKEILQAVEAAPSDNVIILPNNKNIVLSASEVHPLSSKRVEMIPTTTIPQGIAASLAFNSDADLPQNTKFMNEAIKGVKSIKVTRAVRNAKLKGLKLKKGHPIAILDGEKLLTSDKNLSNVISTALTEAEGEKAEVITIYYGDNVDATEAGRLAQEIDNKYRASVEVTYGGQLHCDYIISLE